MGSFLSQKTVSITFFIDHCSQNFFFWLECSPNGPGDLCSITGRVIPKTQKMVHDATSALSGKDQG